MDLKNVSYTYVSVMNFNLIDTYRSDADNSIEVMDINVHKYSK